MEEQVEETSQAVEEQAVAVGAEEEGALEQTAFDEDRLASILESVLFAAGEPIPLKRLVEVLDGPNPAEVRGALRVVGERLETSGRGVRLVEVAGGYQLRTARENAEWVRAVFRDKPRKLGRAALETLAVVAYRQPITRAEVEAIRGVDIDAVLTTLLQRDLVKIVGRRETVGRPILYGTTEAFLELFGYRDLREMPTLKELPQGSEVNPNEQANTAPEGSETAEAGEALPAGLGEGDSAAQAAEAAAPGDEGVAPGSAGLAAGDEETAAAGEETVADGGATLAHGGDRTASAAETTTAAADAESDGAGEAAEAAQPGGDLLASEGGGSDPRGEGDDQRPGGEGAGDEGGSEEGPDQR